MVLGTTEIVIMSCLFILVFVVIPAFFLWVIFWRYKVTKYYFQYDHVDETGHVWIRFWR